MSEQDSGSKDRATVALAVEKIVSLDRLVTQRFDALGDRLVRIETLPAQMAALHERQTLSEARLLILEKRDDSSAEWRRGPLFSALVVFGCTLISAATTLGVLLLSHHL